MSRVQRIFAVVSLIAFAVGGANAAFQALRPAPAAAAAAAGVSLAEDWVIKEALAQPGPRYLTQGQGDARYGRLKFANTWTAANTFNNLTAKDVFTVSPSGVGHALVVDVNDDANWAYLKSSVRITGALHLDSVMTSTGNISNSGATYIYAGTVGLDSQGPTMATTYLRSRGVASGSLPTCDATMEGALEYDTTVDRLAICDNVDGNYRWRFLLTSGGPAGNKSQGSSYLGKFFSGAIVSPESTNYMGAGVSLSASGPFELQTLSTVTIACAWETAGVGAGTVEMNYTDGTRTCTCNLGNCTTAARTNVSCTCAPSGTFSGAGRVQMTSATNCATSNPGTVWCDVYADLTLN